MKIHLHLGAHKTATTFVQSQLFDNRAGLAASHIGIVGIWVLRKRFTRLFEALSWLDPFWAPLTRMLLRARLNSILAEHHHRSLVILSDENLAGLIAGNYRRGGLYPAIGQRMRKLKSILSDHEVKVFFSIRPYPDYLISSYLQLAARGRAPSFEQFMARFPASMRGWSEVVSALVAVMGKENVTICTYDWFRQDPSRLLRLLAPDGLQTVEDSELKRDILPSLTVKGLEMMKHLEPHLSSREKVKMGKLLRGFEFDEPNPRLEIDDAGLLEAWRQKYQMDLRKIRAMDVSFYEADPIPAKSV